MPRFGTIIAVLSLASCALAYGWRAPFRDLPQGIKLETAAAAEQKGDIARARNDYLMAVSYYQRAVRAGAPNSELYTKLGIAQFQLGNRGAARKSFLEAVKIDPRNADALNNVGALLCVDKKYKPALHYLKQALEIDEANAAYHVNIGEAWAGLGQIDRAMTEYARALRARSRLFRVQPGRSGRAAPDSGAAGTRGFPDRQGLCQEGEPGWVARLSAPRQGRPLSPDGRRIHRQGVRRTVAGSAAQEDRETIGPVAIFLGSLNCEAKRAIAMVRSRPLPLQRFQNCCTPEPLLLSGVFLWKTPPFATLKEGT